MALITKGYNTFINYLDKKLDKEVKEAFDHTMYYIYNEEIPSTKNSLHQKRFKFNNVKCVLDYETEDYYIINIYIGNTYNLYITYETIDYKKCLTWYYTTLYSISCGNSENHKEHTINIYDPNKKFKFHFTKNDIKPAK